MTDNGMRIDGESEQGTTEPAKGPRAVRGALEEDHRNRRDLEYFQRLERLREAEAAKIARLRALRLAKEAQERAVKAGNP